MLLKQKKEKKSNISEGMKPSCAASGSWWRGLRRTDCRLDTEVLGPYWVPAARPACGRLTPRAGWGTLPGVGSSARHLPPGLHREMAGECSAGGGARAW